MKIYEFRLKFPWSKFVLEVRINNMPALVQIMAWRRSGDKLLSELMLATLLAHICGTRPQWVNSNMKLLNFKQLSNKELRFVSCVLCMSQVMSNKIHVNLTWVRRWQIVKCSSADLEQTKPRGGVLTHCGPVVKYMASYILVSIGSGNSLSPNH